MSNPFFSVLIPVYNQVGKMDRCVETIKKQGFKDFEVICVNDGSTDDSLNMLNGFAEEDPRFRVVSYEKNRSLVGARYAGMQEAKGSYILLVDSDDYIEPDMFEIIHKRLLENPVDVLRFGAVFEPAKTVYAPVPSDDVLMTFLAGKEIAAVWKRAYSADLIKRAVEKIEPFYANMGEDTFFSSVFLTLANSFDDIPDVLYHYETGGMSSMTGQSVSMEKLLRDLGSAKEVEDHVIPFIEREKPGYLDAAKKACRFIKRYIVSMDIISEPDYAKLVRDLVSLKDAGYKDIVEFTARHMFEYRIKREWATKDPEHYERPDFLSTMETEE